MTAIVLSRSYMDNVNKEINVCCMKTPNSTDLPLLQRQLSIPDEDVPLVKRALSREDEAKDEGSRGHKQQRRRKVNVLKKKPNNRREGMDNNV
eukprot:g1606.t1